MPEVQRVADGAGVTVAVIDSGVDASIPALSGALVAGTNVVAGGDGTVDYDETGHGTAMASLIASRGGESGVVGVAPAATVLPIGIVGTQPSADQQADMSTAIRYAVDNGAHVINISWAGLALDGCPENEAAAIRYALGEDVVVVAGTGNHRDGTSEVPGACPGVLTVGAIDQRLEPADYSHRSEHVEVSAPGTGILAAQPGGGSTIGDGTSNSTALVSGVVALVRAAFQDASAYEVVARILATVRDVGPSGRDDATGYGMVRPYEALTAEVPADAPNPVFDNAGDLTDVAPPSPDPTAFEAPEAPNFGAPPSAGDDGPAVGAIVAISAVGALILVAAVIVIAIVLARSRRRRLHPYPPGPPPPPDLPGPR
jgi:type VII secretion-associated serine protease mycosin